ncbi:MAG: hypothetical protein AB8I08_15395 [Sandaracinaceae bacterium]
MSPRSIAALLALPALVACELAGSDVDLQPPPPARVSVGETLRLRVDVDNPSGRELTYRVVPVWEGTLPGFETVHAVSGSPTGAEFRWTPLVSHTGEQELRFEVDADGVFADSETVVITVLPAADAAPAFVRPGSGGAFDLARTPCIDVPLEVRDGDSATVDIRAREPLPEGATLTDAGPKSADFRWCPSSAQIAASQRWVLAFEAEDETHPPVPKDYVVVLRTTASEDCPGALPEVGVRSPEDGTRTDSKEIVAFASDAEGLRDAPLLYWTTETPEDLASPDVTRFEQVTLRARGDDFVGDVDLALDAGEERLVYYLISAVDNDDDAGSLCDHRVDGPLRTVTLVGGAAVERDACEPCTASSDCASNVCAPSSGGSVCLPLCDACETGTCGMRATVEGPLAMACGDADAACAPLIACTEDMFEPDGTRAEATVRELGRVTGLGLCDSAGDHHRFDAQFADLVTFRVDNFMHADGNLDLRVLNESGSIVAVSEGLEDTESASHCATSDAPVYAHVFGFEGATGPYDLVVERVRDGCCVDDTNEPDDAVATARPDGSAIEGVLCPGDDDVYVLLADRPTRVTLTLSHDRGDLDAELRAPDGVTVIALASTGGLSETLVAEVTGGGRYTFRVFSAGTEASPYTGALEVEEMSACAATPECAAGDACESGTCVDAACTDTASCPAAHVCAVGQCSPTCSVNADCRSSEACKRSFQGRVCGARGSGVNGAACVDFTDCGGQRECVAPSLGGFCARVGCSTNSECETGTFCVGDASLSICSIACTPGTCRDGFACTLIATLEGPSEAVCWPE